MVRWCRNYINIFDRSSGTAVWSSYPTWTTACSSAEVAAVVDVSLGPARARKSISFSQLPRSAPVTMHSGQTALYSSARGAGRDEPYLRRRCNIGCRAKFVGVVTGEAGSPFEKSVSRRRSDPSMREPRLPLGPLVTGDPCSCSGTQFAHVAPCRISALPPQSGAQMVCKDQPPDCQLALRPAAERAGTLPPPQPCASAPEHLVRRQVLLASLPGRLRHPLLRNDTVCP